MLSDSWQQFYDQLGDWRVQGNNEADWQDLQFGVSQGRRKYASDWEGDARLRELMLANARDQQAFQNHASPFSQQWHALRARLNSSAGQISQLQQRRAQWEASQKRAAAPQPAQPQQAAPAQQQPPPPAPPTPAPAAQQPAQPQAPAPKQQAAPVQKKPSGTHQSSRYTPPPGQKVPFLSAPPPWQGAAAPIPPKTYAGWKPSKQPY